MLEDAINQIAGIINSFPEIKEITIKNKNHITIFIQNEKLQAETFSNSVELLEWCEENLKSPLNNVTIKNKVRDFLDFFKKKVKR
tara:strand:- start:28 stop:282 length:255 start_codon:yes stop_codon:yes gene_type:complete